MNICVRATAEGSNPGTYIMSSIESKYDWIPVNTFASLVTTILNVVWLREEIRQISRSGCEGAETKKSIIDTCRDASERSV